MRFPTICLQLKAQPIILLTFVHRFASNFLMAKSSLGFNQKNVKNVNDIRKSMKQKQFRFTYAREWYSRFFPNFVSIPMEANFKWYFNCFGQRFFFLFNFILKPNNKPLMENYFQDFFNYYYFFSSIYFVFNYDRHKCI